MIAEWFIARTQPRCQYDFQPIVDGEPYQRVTHARVKRKFIRCLHHALVPPDDAAIAAAYAEDERVQEKNAIDAAEAAQPTAKVIRIKRQRPLRAFSSIADVDLFDPKLAASGRDR